jgi:hypothetical protein
MEMILLQGNNVYIKLKDDIKRIIKTKMHQYFVIYGYLSPQKRTVDKTVTFDT